MKGGDNVKKEQRKKLGVHKVFVILKIIKALLKIAKSLIELLN